MKALETRLGGVVAAKDALQKALESAQSELKDSRKEAKALGERLREEMQKKNALAQQMMK